ncbi:MAG: TRAP transporter small permease subunit [Desulfobacteraceae bacterium]|jgi:TRAP-type mannitol/chloroaromatic compound transport system permease small subunit
MDTLQVAKCAGKSIDKLSRSCGQAVSYVVLLIMFNSTWEVLSRYLLNHPTQWVWPINRQLFGIFILFAGVYTMSQEGHIRVEIIYDFLPPQMKRVAKIISILCFILFMGVLIWQSTWMGWNSFTSREVASGAFRVPMYPFKLLIPIVSVLFLLEGLVVMLPMNKRS